MTLLIKGGRVFTGVEGRGRRADIFVREDRIVHIGRVPEKTADTVVSAEGVTVVPGFIDAVSDADHQLTLWQSPHQEDYVRQGVTTIVCGHGGVSLAPLLYGHTDLLEDWADRRGFNVDWNTMAEFFGRMSRRPLGVNVLTLMGYATIRHAIAGSMKRALTRSEARIMGSTIERGIREGARGISFSFDARNRIPISEFTHAVAHVANGVVSLWIGDDREFLADAIRAIKGTSVPVLIANGSMDSLSALDGMPERRDIEVACSASGIHAVPLERFLPQWAEREARRDIVSRLHDPWYAKRVEGDLPNLIASRVRIAFAPGHPALRGKTLRDFMKMRGIREPARALVALMRAVNLRALMYASTAGTEPAQTLCAHPRTLIASCGVMPMPHAAREEDLPLWENETSGFALFLEKIHGEQWMPLSRAILKLTRDPANFFGIKSRGELREGYFADIVGIKGGRVIFTIVNGKVSYHDGDFTGVSAGRVLRKGNLE